MLILLGASGCAKLGYSNRVLHRAPSPDGRVIAVCQERPEFDGPGYGIRLHHPDGRVLRGLYEIGDGHPCDEVVWAPDGKTLGVLSKRNAVLKLVDVEWALAHPSVQTSHHSWREVYLGDVIERRAGEFTMADRLRFPSTIEVQLCGCSPARQRHEGIARCAEEPMTHSMPVPQPIFEKRRHDSAHAATSQR
jgi:hypothetical protein